MSKRVRCAIIGSGFAGSTYAEAVRYAADAELVAIAGGHQAPDIAARHELASVRDVGGRIGRVDMVAMVQTEPDQTTWLTKPETGATCSIWHTWSRPAAMVAGGRFACGGAHRPVSR